MISIAKLQSLISIVLLVLAWFVAVAPGQTATADYNSRRGLELLAAAGADVKSLNQYGGNALIPACHYGHFEVVRELLKSKIDVNHVNNLGWTALLETVILGDGGAKHREIMELLLRHGANVNLADRDRVTPLAHAQWRGYTEMVQLLQKSAAR